MSSSSCVGERERVPRHVGDLVGAVGHRRLADVAVVEDHGPCAGREGRTCGIQASVSAGEAHHAQERLALTVDLVVEPLSVHLCDRHGPQNKLAAMRGVAVVTGRRRGFGRAIAARLAAPRLHIVLATDVDAEAAAATAEEIGGFSMQLDVRDPEAAPRAPRAPRPSTARSRCGSTTPASCARARRGSTRTTTCGSPVDVDLLGVIWGSLAAVDAMKRGAATGTS